ncbi:MAG: hypothetical protein ACTSPW_10645, partial [Promethearchaeota archaeon]
NDFISTISKIFEEWEKCSKLYDKKFQNYFKNIIEDNDSEEFLNLYEEIHTDKNLQLSIFEIEAHKISLELQERFNLNFGKPKNFNLEKNEFDLFYFIPLNEIYNVLNSLKEQNDIIEIKKSLIEHIGHYTKKINENIELRYNLIRIIEFDTNQNQDLIEVIKIFIIIFSKTLQKEKNYSLIDLFEEFKKYIDKYNKIQLKYKLNNLIDFYLLDEIYSLFIDEINKYEIIFIENLIIEKLNAEFENNFIFKIIDLRFIDKEQGIIWYEINESNHKDIVNNFNLIDPLNVEFQHKFDINMKENLKLYFLPEMKDQNIFKMEWFDEFIIKRLKDYQKISEEKDYFLLEELKDRIEEQFSQLISFYDQIKYESILSKSKIRKYINNKLRDKNFLRNFLILDPLIIEQLKKDKIIEKYQIFNENKIYISNKERHVEIKLSKKEILSFRDINDFKYITNKYNIKVKLKSQNLVYNYRFEALDKFGIIYIELLKYYFKNYDDYSSENFQKIDYEDFKDYISEKYKNSEYLNEINGKLKNLNNFKEYLSELNNILNKC